MTKDSAKARMRLFFFFGDMGEGFIRLSLLVPTEKIEEAFDRIERYLKARGL